ncbi:MAG: DUF45 domain-containing protein [Candidatus Aminicenantes bacterium]|nr:DUF45 domain-containing protein [Candidatus Aminicenantes bacterium]
MNHSSKFWLLVQKYCPEYKTHKAELKQKNDWLKYPANTISNWS